MKYSKIKWNTHTHIHTHDAHSHTHAHTHTYVYIYISISISILIYIYICINYEYDCHFFSIKASYHGAAYTVSGKQRITRSSESLTDCERTNLTWEKISRHSMEMKNPPPGIPKKVESIPFIDDIPSESIHLVRGFSSWLLQVRKCSHAERWLHAFPCPNEMLASEPTLVTRRTLK